jgi:uncharacterized Fe-S center protein
MRLLEAADLAPKFGGKRVAIKMHVGGDMGYYTVHPIFVKILVDALKKVDARPFLVDGSFSTDAAPVRGYTPEVVGARVVGAGGEFDKYYYTRTTEVPGLPEIELCGHIVDAEAMIILSHGKGHGHTGFGGATKNIGMGCVSCKTRGGIHGLMGSHFEWDSEICTHCGQCISGCPTGAIKFNDADKIEINEHFCRYCMHCVTACASNALQMEQPVEKFRAFQAGMAAVVKETLSTFKPENVYFITAVMNVTPLCDCWGFSTQPIIPDVGIFASDNIVAIEQASLDKIHTEDLIPNTLPDQLLPIGKEGHLFERVHGKDPYEQVRQCAAAGLGSEKYSLEEIK